MYCDIKLVIEIFFLPNISSGVCIYPKNPILVCPYLHFTQENSSYEGEAPFIRGAHNNTGHCNFTLQDCNHDHSQDKQNHLCINRFSDSRVLPDVHSRAAVLSVVRSRKAAMCSSLKHENMAMYNCYNK